MSRALILILRCPGLWEAEQERVAVELRVTHCPGLPRSEGFPRTWDFQWDFNTGGSWANQEELVTLATIGPTHSLLKDTLSRGDSMYDQCGRKRNV